MAERDADELARALANLSGETPADQSSHGQDVIEGWDQPAESTPEAPPAPRRTAANPPQSGVNSATSAGKATPARSAPTSAATPANRPVSVAPKPQSVAKPPAGQSSKSAIPLRAAIPAQSVAKPVTIAAPRTPATVTPASAPKSPTTRTSATTQAIIAAGPPGQGKAVSVAASVMPRQAASSPQVTSAPPVSPVSQVSTENKATQTPQPVQPATSRPAPPSRAATPPMRATSPPAPGEALPTGAATPPTGAATPPIRAATPPARAATPPIRAAAPPARVATPPMRAAAQPARTAAPPARTAAPPARAVGPQSLAVTDADFVDPPTDATPEVISPAEDDFMSGAVSEEEDDVMLAPAPEMQTLISAHAAARSQRVKPAPRRNPDRFRLASIPILLTCGMLLIVTGIIELTAPAENPLTAPMTWMPYALFGAGAALAGLAIANRMQLAAMVAARRRAAVKNENSATDEN
jgi:hypothetical protein